MKALNQMRTKGKDSLPSGSKKRGRPNYEPEPMVIMPAIPAESVTQYSLALPSSNKDRTLDEMDTLRKITKNLNKIVNTMEGTYVKDDETEEEEEEEEEEAAPKEDLEDMTSFLLCCSQLSNQLEKAVHEEKQILESLLKWFEKEVHEMEELGEEQLIPDWQIPIADKNITDNISKLLNRIQRLEELKGRVQELPKLIQQAAPKPEKKRPITPVAPAPKDPKNIIEELAMKHATEDVMNMVQVFQDESGQPQTIESMNNRMIEIMKVFERQTNKLHRVANEQDVLEGKLKKIQQEFRKLAEEKEIMEDELQKMKSLEPSEKMGADTRKQMLQTVEKAKAEEKVSAERAQPLPAKQKEKQKMKEDLAKAQENIKSLENEKKMLEEKLQKALEEAERAKSHLAEVPPTIPDFQFTYTAAVEDEKDIPKKGKKAKFKGKGEDRTDLKSPSPTGADRTMPKLQKDTGKAGETQDLSTTPSLKDIKQKKKMSIFESQPSGVQEITSGITDKKEESKKSKKKTEVDSKSVAKSKETAETKKRRSITKGTGKKSPILPSVQERKQLPDSTGIEAILPAPLVRSPEEILPPDSERIKTDITMLPEFGIQEEKEDSLSSEQKVSPLPGFQIEEPVEFEKIMGVSETRPAFGVAVASEPTGTMEGKTVFTSEKILTSGKEIPGGPIDSLRYGEVETKDTINKSMLQLADNLKELEGMPEAESLAKMLLEPDKSMDELPDQQKLRVLQLLNELITPGEIEQTEEEINEMTKKRGVLLGTLKTILDNVKQPQSIAGPFQEDIDREVNKLSEEQRLLLDSLESNMKDLEEAKALAATQPLEMNENKVKELLKQRGLLVENLEANLQDLQRVKSFEIGLNEKDKHEGELYEMHKISEKKQELLEKLESNQKELQEAQDLAATQPGIVSEDKLKKLAEQRKRLTEELKSTVIGEEIYQIHRVSEKKRELLEKLESNKKELQEAQELAATQPGIVSDQKLKELTEQRKRLTEELDSTVIEGEVYQMRKVSEKKQELLEKLESNQKALEAAQELAATQPGIFSEQMLEELAEQRKRLTEELKSTMIEGEMYQMRKVSEKKRELLEKLESNQKEVQEAQELAATQPGIVSEHKLKELIEQRRHLTEELKSTGIDIHLSESPMFARISERELNQMHNLSEKKLQLLEELESNQKKLQEAQELAVTQPGNVSEQKLQELAEQKRHLTAELESTLDDMQAMFRRASERTVFVQPVERDLDELSTKKQDLLEQLESNRKELQEAQELAIIKPGSISEHKLQELMKKRRLLTTDLETTMQDIQRVRDSTSEGVAIIRPSGREFYELSSKKQELLEKLESNEKELQEAQKLATTQPDKISEQKLQELTEQRKRLAEELEITLYDMRKVERHVSERALIGKPSEKELYDLSVKKQVLQEKIESIRKELEEARTLEASHPGSISEHKLQALEEQGRRLSAELKATVQNIQKVQQHVSKRTSLTPTEREIYELTEKKELLESYLESNWKALQEAQAFAATRPERMSEHKLHDLFEERKQLTADLKTAVQDLREAENRASDRAVIEQPHDRELYDLFEKKHLLQAKLDFNWKELQEAQNLAESQPGGISEQRLQELYEERRYLTEDLQNTFNDIAKTQRSLSIKAAAGKPVEKELYELSERKQLLLENLKGLQEAQAFAATLPGLGGEEKRKQLSEQRRRLAADLEATVHDMQKPQHIPDVPQMLGPSEMKLYELSEKKCQLLESLASNRKELQDAQALADAQPGSVSDQRLQILTEQRKRLTEDLKATVHDIQEIQRRASQRTLAGKSTERELFELFEKKQLLMESLQAKQKELQETEYLETSQPGSISEQKMQELKEQKTLLTAALETTIHDIRGIQRRVSCKALFGETGEWNLYKLHEWKQLLLEHLEVHLKEAKETDAFAASEPDRISQEKIQELNEQRKILTENLEAVVQDIQEMKAAKTRDTIRPIEKDSSQLLEKKMWLLDCLELNMVNLQAAQRLAATQPSSISKEKVQEVIDERRLLTAGLEAVNQDLQEIQNLPQEKIGTRSREEILKDLSEKRRIFLKNLASNLKDLKEAQGLAVAQPGGISEQKVQELTEQRRLLAAGLELIMKEIQGLVSDKKEVLKPSDELYEKRRAFIENVDLYLEELKDLQTFEDAKLNEQKKEQLAEKRAFLAAGIESFLLDMQEAQDLDSDHTVVASPDKKKINDVIELSRLESKLGELEEAGALSDDQLNNIRTKIHELKKQKMRLIDREEPPTLDNYPKAYGVDRRDKEKAVKDFLEKRKSLFTFLQSSIRDLKQKNIIQQSSVPAEEKIEDIPEDGNVLDVMVVPVALLKSETGSSSSQYEQNAPRDLFQTPSRRRIILTESLPDKKLLKPSFSGLQIQINKAPVIVKAKTEHQKKTDVFQDQQDKTLLPRRPKSDYTYTDIKKTDIEFSASVQDQEDKNILKEIERAFRRESTPQQPMDKTLPPLPTGVVAVDAALRDILNYDKSLLPGNQANLQQVLQTVQLQLQKQQAHILSEKLTKLSAFIPQPPGTTRFHDYSLPPLHSAWETNQLPQKDYVRKLKMLKKRLMGSDLKELLKASSPIQRPTSLAKADHEVDSIAICGKGVSPFRKLRALPVIKQKLRHH